MKVVILAGGFGTRIMEESHLIPKPMVEIGGMPILWHIMKTYSHHGFNDFIICCGYKQYVIKEWFANYFLHNSDVTFDFSNGNKREVHTHNSEPWRVTVIDTGLHTMTGGRVKRVREYIGDEPFLLTYGDGVADIDISATVEFHNSHNRLATMTAIQPDSRFGVMDLDNDQILAFREKSKTDASWINGGFMVLDPKVIDYIEDDTIMFENEPLQAIANEGNLMSYKHYGFWQCMDTLRDKEKLEEMWTHGNAPWRVWND